ncbi:hypothetical protein BC940DRAFT_178934 [Gongronella butleri]|nr:hypothetical protein BC940DRAFT_178934 [Gongronella butleri]
MDKVILYDLEIFGVDYPISPMTARTRILLNIKGIPYETKWLNFLELHEQIPILTNNHKDDATVPVIKDGFHGDRIVPDSLAIAKYLEATFPETPVMLAPDTHGLIDYLTRSIYLGIQYPVLRLAMLNIHKSLPTQEMRDWFKKDRAERLKCSIEEFARDDATNIADLKAPMELIDHVLKTNRYIAGEKVGYADCIVGSTFVFLRGGRPDIFEAAMLDAVPGSDRIRTWWARIEPYTGLEPPKENTIDTA